MGMANPTTGFFNVLETVSKQSSWLLSVLLVAAVLPKAQGQLYPWMVMHLCEADTGKAQAECRGVGSSDSEKRLLL